MAIVSIIVVLACISAVVFYVYSLKKNKDKIQDVDAPYDSLEQINEPIISYSIYTVDTKLNHRFLNYAHKDFPNHFGILNHQYIEIDWNVINADFISIDGVGLVKAVGRKSFYPTENTKYVIHAKNKEYTLEQEIYVRIFPVHVSEKLFASVPSIQFYSSFEAIETIQIKSSFVNIPKPNSNIVQPTYITIKDTLKNSIPKTSTFSMLLNYFNKKKNKI